MSGSLCPGAELTATERVGRSPLPRAATAGDPAAPPLRVTHVVSTLLVGGMEQLVLQLAEAQQARGHSVGIMAAAGGPLQERARDLGLRVEILPAGSRVARVARAALLMGRQRPQVVHIHNPSSYRFGALGRLLAGASL